MQFKVLPKVFSNFFLDGAKIIFGSMVVGAFIPSAVSQTFPITTFVAGAIMTFIFLIIANQLEEHDTIQELSQ